jgi:hypothetical protein
MDDTSTWESSAGSSSGRDRWWVRPGGPALGRRRWMPADAGGRLPSARHTREVILQTLGTLSILNPFVCDSGQGTSARGRVDPGTAAGGPRRFEGEQGHF